MADYVYSIENDFPNHKVDPSRLAQEIMTSTITAALDVVRTAGDVCTIVFKASLSSDEEVALDGLVAVHSGEPLPAPVQEVTLAGVPTTDDGKPQMVPNLLPSWASLYFAGQGDDRDDGLGEGQAFICTSDTNEDKTVEWIYTSQIYLVGGSVIFSGAELGDTMDYVVVAPATETGVGTTLVTLIEYGAGHTIVPDPGGASTIDLQDVGLVPTPGVGYWDWSEPSEGYGTVTPNYEGKGNFSLFDFEVPLGHPLVKLHPLGSNKIDFLMSNITPMRVLPQWLHRAVIHNSGHSGLKLAWMFVGGRGGAI